MDDLNLDSWTRNDWCAYRKERRELVRSLKKLVDRQNRGLDVSVDVDQLYVRTAEWELKKI